MSRQDRVKIFDTTLRDGEQSPGATMNIKEKLQIAHQLQKMRVDIVEAGFPFSSPGDFDSVQAIAQDVRGVTVCALARCSEKDILKASEALALATEKRLHVFIATSKIHRQYKLKKSREDVLKMAVDGVRQARECVADVEFSAEDATRTELPFLIEVLHAVIDAGAKTVNIPDTVGYTTPFEMAKLISILKEEISEKDGVVLSVHCHDDLGMAVANSLAAIQNGVRQVECAINGIGERAGNCATEEIVMALRTRESYFGLQTGVISEEIVKTSKMVSGITGMVVQPNKSIVGCNAFAHEAGIHQDGMIKNRNTYEIMNPEDVGWGQSELVLGKHSGRNAFDKRLRDLGYDLDSTDKEQLFLDFKNLCDRKKTVYNDDLIALVNNRLDLSTESSLSVQEIDIHYQFTVQEKDSLHSAQVCLKNNRSQKLLKGSGSGEGPVYAILQAVKTALGVQIELLSYKINSVTSGHDALGEVLVKVRLEKDSVCTGRFVSVDVLEASAKALLHACEPYCSKLFE